MKKNAKLSPRQKTLLVFLGSGGEGELDPIRIMKGLFLIAVETPNEWLSAESRYQFEPYTYGPCSFDLYSDLDQLRECGYVRSKEAPGRTWKYYSLTRQGTELAKHLAEAMNLDARRYFKTIRRFVEKTPFRQLLSAIYQRYPQYAVNSVFKF